MEYYRNELAKYLAKARGPKSAPLTYKLQPRPTGEVARHVVTEYDIPIAELDNERAPLDGSEWSAGIPSGMHGGGGMHDAVVDDDGNAWITDSVANNFRTLARVDPRTGQVTGFKVTAPDGRRARNSHGITKDRNGILWFDTAGSLGRVDPTTEAFEVYTPPMPLRVGGSPMVDGKGKIWIGNPHGALRFDPDTNEFEYFQNKTVGDGQTYGTAADRLGNGWWAQFNQDIVGHANASTGEVSEVHMRPPWTLDEEQLLTPADREFFHRIGALRFSGNVYNPGSQAPRRLFADPNGDSVWVANWWGHNLAKIDINTFETTYYRLPLNSHPYATAVDRNHMVGRTCRRTMRSPNLIRTPDAIRYTNCRASGPSCATSRSITPAGRTFGWSIASPVEPPVCSSEQRHSSRRYGMPPAPPSRVGDTRPLPELPDAAFDA